MIESTEPVTLVGRIDGITPDGTVTGWCWSPQEPLTQREIALVAEDVILVTVLAGQLRDDLARLGIGNGSHGFSATIPRDCLGPAAGAVNVQLRDVALARPVGAFARYTYSAAATSSQTYVLRAFLDEVGEEGLVRGWCWSPSEPERQVELNVLIDGTIVGSTVANIYRGDLEKAGIGDGSHAFTFLLPWNTIAARSAVQVTLADAVTGAILPASSIFRRPVLQPVEERLRDLERQMRLLASQVAEAERRAEHDRTMLRGVLATVGTFFTRLSQTESEDIATAFVPSLPELVADTADRLKPIQLAIPEQPVMTVCIPATGTLEEVYACIASCQAAGLDRHADIVVLDGGEVAEAALLPSVIRDLRYWRLPFGQPYRQALLTTATKPARTFTALLSPAVRMRTDWLDCTLAMFGQHQSCGMFVPKLVREEAVAGFGLLPQAGRLIDPALAGAAADPEFDHVRAVAAPSAEAFVIRTSLLETLGGFDPSFSDAFSSLADLALRCWAKGRSVLSQGSVRLAWQNSVLERPRSAGEAVALVSQRWFTAIPEAWPRPLGHILVVGGENPISDLHCATALKALGWQVSFATPRLDGTASPADTLRVIGVRVLRRPFQSSLSDAIVASKGGYAMIRLVPSALPTLSLERTRSCSPKSKLLLEITGNAADAAVLLAAPAADIIIAKGSAAAVLAQAGHSQMLLPSAVDTPGFAARHGIWLLTGPGKAGTADMAWLVTAVLPALRKALPGVQIHRPAQPGLKKRAGMIDEADAAARAGMRLVLAACRQAAPEPAEIAACAEEGTPLLLFCPLSPCDTGEQRREGVVKLSPSTAAAVREVACHYAEAALWEAAAPPHLSAEEARVARWATALDRLGLSSYY